MPSFSLHPPKQEPNAEFYMLTGAKPDGDRVAVYRDHAVSDVVIDEYGHRYIFAGVVPRKANGTFDVRGLKAGEVIVQPGLIYQRIPVKRRLF